MKSVVVVEDTASHSCPLSYQILTPTSMAFVTSGYIHKATLGYYSIFKCNPCDSGSRLRSLPVTSCVKKQPNPKTTATEQKRNGAVICPIDEVSNETILPTPSYNPSLFSIAYDLFRQKLSNRELSHKFGPIYKTKNFFGALTMISDHDAIVEISQKPHLFAASDSFPDQFITLTGHDALMFIDGKKHETGRAKLRPCFAPSTISSFQKTIVDNAREFFHSLAHKTSSSPRPVSAINPVKEYFLDLIISLTVNADRGQNNREVWSNCDHQKNVQMLNSDFATFLDGLISPKFLPQYRKALVARDKLQIKLKKILLERLRDKSTRAKLRSIRDHLDKDKIGNIFRRGETDLMAILIATSSLDLTDNDETAVYESGEIAEEVRSLVDLLRFVWLAGHTTQTSTLLCVLMEIFSDANLLERLQDEQNCIADLTTNSMLHDMPLLSSVLTESMRINPAPSMIFKRATEDVVVLGHLVQKGTVIAIDYSSANMDATLFPSPEDFIPDRFVDKPEVARKVLLFGAVGSAHYCIGASLAITTMKTTLAIMLREFDIEIEPWKRRLLKHIPETQPRNGVWIRSCTRKQL